MSQSVARSHSRCHAGSSSNRGCRRGRGRRCGDGSTRSRAVFFWCSSIFATRSMSRMVCRFRSARRLACARARANTKGPNEWGLSIRYAARVSRGSSEQWSSALVGEPAGARHWRSPCSPLLLPTGAATDVPRRVRLIGPAACDHSTGCPRPGAEAVVSLSLGARFRPPHTGRKGASSGCVRSIPPQWAPAHTLCVRI